MNLEEAATISPETAGDYTVWVDDNFRYQAESERYMLGQFSDLEAALTASKKIIIAYLMSAYRPGMSAEELYESYVSFGEDPWIEGVSPAAFSAWDFAKEHAAEIAARNA